MKLSFSQLALTSALLLPISAWAVPVPIEASYTVTANSADPGLVIQTADEASNPFSFSLEEGESRTFDLFSIWTNETDVGRDDKVSKPISVVFDFTLPDLVSGGVSGTTDGAYLFIVQGGVLEWLSPLTLMFGAQGDGELRIELFDEDFNWGVFGLTEGEKFGATVEAKVTLVSNATEVPEPGTLALLGLGMLGLGLSSRRTK